MLPIYQLCGSLVRITAEQFLTYEQITMDSSVKSYLMTAEGLVDSVVQIETSPTREVEGQCWHAGGQLLPVSARR